MGQIILRLVRPYSPEEYINGFSEEHMDPDTRVFRPELTIGHAMRMWLVHGYETEVLEYSPTADYRDPKCTGRYRYWAAVLDQGGLTS